jgi:hypothetical protein
VLSEMPVIVTPLYGSAAVAHQAGSDTSVIGSKAPAAGSAGAAATSAAGAAAGATGAAQAVNNMLKIFQLCRRGDPVARANHGNRAVQVVKGQLRQVAGDRVQEGAAFAGIRTRTTGPSF